MPNIHRDFKPFYSYSSENRCKYEGVAFNQTDLNLQLGPGLHQELKPGGEAATELALVSIMANSAETPDGAPVARIKLYSKDGRVTERELQAGRDTSEWAYDRADVRQVVKHRQARIVESLESDGFQAHRYLARITFDRAEVERIEFDYLRSEANLLIVRASLYDETTGTSIPLDALSLPVKRWNRIGRFGKVDVYENLNVKPRTWFVRSTLSLPSSAVLSAIKQGKLPDGAAFDPSDVALLETEDIGERESVLPAAGDATAAQVQVTRSEPHRIELQTHHRQAGFLVLSEIYYRGWNALVDGQAAPIYRADYVLRGIAIPPGDHHIVFVYQPRSFRNGAIYSALGVIFLLTGAVISGRRKP